MIIFQQAYRAIQASEEQFRSLQTENKQLEQEVVKEKTVVLQVTAEKGEIEQHLEVRVLCFPKKGFGRHASVNLHRFW